MWGGWGWHSAGTWCWQALIETLRSNSDSAPLCCYEGPRDSSVPLLPFPLLSPLPSLWGSHHYLLITELSFLASDRLADWHNYVCACMRACMFTCLLLPMCHALLVVVPCFLTLMQVSLPICAGTCVCMEVYVCSEYDCSVNECWWMGKKSKGFVLRRATFGNCSVTTLNLVQFFCLCKTFSSVSQHELYMDCFAV